MKEKIFLDDDNLYVLRDSNLYKLKGDSFVKVPHYEKADDVRIKRNQPSAFKGWDSYTIPFEE